MKRLLVGIALLATASFLGGCPIYGTQPQGDYQVCTGSACYSCPTPAYSNACTYWPCQSNYDCPTGYCDPNNYVCDSPAPDGSSGFDAGDCTVTGCPPGETCFLPRGVPECVVMDFEASTPMPEAGTSDASDGGTGTMEAGKGDASDSGNPLPGPCNADGDCGGNGAKCVDGTCATQVHLCSDGSQCEAPGFSCVDGLCEPSCSGSSPCPTGYQCDLTRGVCNVNPGACSGSGTSSCQGGTVCVDTHCVPPCTASDAGPACPTSQVCVNGGCIPDQSATFACSNDGESGSLATTCSANDVCLHHDCYTQCTTDAGGCQGTQTCKNVTIETGTYSVCGTATTLGSACDPSQGNYCMTSGKVCVDGYCL